MSASRQQRSLSSMIRLSSPTARRLRRHLPAVSLAAGLAIALTGCHSSAQQVLMTGGIPDDYRHNHPIAVEELLDTMDVPVGQDTVSLTGPVKSAIAGFGQKFADSGSGLIAVVAPSGSPNQVAAASIAVQIEAVLRASGVNSRSIEYRVYRAGPEERNAPVRIAFNRIQAHTAPCGPWPDQVADTGENRLMSSFGCATQQNLAAMVASPLDLIYPRGLTPADAVRRATVLEKYRKGESFTSDTSRDTGGTVATGVGQP
jgi:pilus assembly protein CpaD